MFAQPWQSVAPMSGKLPAETVDDEKKKPASRGGGRADVEFSSEEGGGITFHGSKTQQRVDSPTPLVMLESQEQYGDAGAAKTESPYVPYPPKNTPQAQSKGQSEHKPNARKSPPRHSLTQDPFNGTEDSTNMYNSLAKNEEDVASPLPAVSDPVTSRYDLPYPPAASLKLRYDPFAEAVVADASVTHRASHGYLPQGAANYQQQLFYQSPSGLKEIPAVLQGRTTQTKSDEKMPATRRTTRAKPTRKPAKLPVAAAAKAEETALKPPPVARTPTNPSADELAQCPNSRAENALKTWYDRLNELEEYRDRTGHCNVPQQYPPNRQLGIWVNKQRMEKKFMDQDEKTSMTPEKVRALESIGFTWAKLKGQASWDVKFRELTVYQQEHGHCNVPTKFRSNPALGRWVSTQRSQYKEFRDGKLGHMTEARYRRLVEIGFRWNMMEEEDDVSNRHHSPSASAGSSSLSSTTSSHLQLQVTKASDV